MFQTCKQTNKPTEVCLLFTCTHICLFVVLRGQTDSVNGVSDPATGPQVSGAVSAPENITRSESLSPLTQKQKQLSDDLNKGSVTVRAFQQAIHESESNIVTQPLLLLLLLLLRLLLLLLFLLSLLLRVKAHTSVHTNTLQWQQQLLIQEDSGLFSLHIISVICQKLRLTQNSHSNSIYNWLLLRECEYLWRTMHPLCTAVQCIRCGEVFCPCGGCWFQGVVVSWVGYSLLTSTPYVSLTGCRVCHSIPIQ